MLRTLAKTVLLFAIVLIPVATALSEEPVDCVVSEWGAWGECQNAQTACGASGARTRERQVVRAAANGGKACPALVEAEACANAAGACPAVSCVVSDWGPWSPCTKPCGGGTHTHTRTIIVQPTGQEQCPALSQEQSCNDQPCPVDCVMSDWGTWTTCSKVCGSGTQTRSRQVVVQAANGGVPCPTDLIQTQPCNTFPCPVNCEVSDWSAWTTCSVTCGGGAQTRTRTIITPAANGGTPCPDTIERLACNTRPCPVDCVVSDWSSWNQCTKPCGSGEQRRTRTVGQQAANGGKACPALEEYQKCNTQPCPINCEVSDFGAWTPCTTTCGGGTRTRTRTIITQSANGGTPCPSVLDETEACNAQACPVDCVVSAWSAWGACSVNCGGGEQQRTRTITVAPQHGGKACPSLTENQPCNLQACPTDCVVSAWSDWTPCSAACAGGTHSRTRTIILQPGNGGVTCPDLTESRSCNEQPCPVDCVVSAWSAWSTCTKACGGGQQTRTRTIETQPANGGKACPTPLTESAACNTQPCPVNCEVSDWSSWTLCAKTCGGGTQNRTRTIITQAQFGGTPCPATLETQHCNTQACPVDCVVSTWGSWGPCDKACGGGIQTQTRTIVQQPANGGAACPGLASTQNCNTQPCPVDCVVSLWGAWSACTKTCGGGTQARTRSVTTPASNGGKACPALTETQSCAIDPCPVNCVVSDWGSWGACSVDCGGGEQSRTRTITTPPLHGGTACPELTQKQACNTQVCVYPCEVSAWSPWAACSKPCGGGTHARHRTILSNVTKCPITTPPPPPPAAQCVCDIMFVVDKSSSIVALPPYTRINTPQNWVAVKDFLKTLIYGTTFTDATGMRIGIASFDRNGYLECGLTHDKNALLSCVDKMTHNGLSQTTNTHLGVQQGLDNLKLASSKSRCRVMKILTDGKSTSPATTLWDALKIVKETEAISVVSIGVAGAVKAELDQMASAPVDKNSILLQDFTNLDQLAHIMLKDCANPATGSGVNTTPTTCKCDIILVLDKSGSIPDADWPSMKDFAKTVIYGVDLVADGSGVRVGIVSFSNSASLDHPLSSDRASLIAAVDGLQKTSGSTNSAAALQTAETELLRDRRYCQTVKFVTDGQSNDPAATARVAADLDAKGIDVLAIGVGPLASSTELTAIASAPKDKNVIMLNDFTGLNQLAHVISATCNERTQACFTSPCPALEETQTCNTQPCPVDCVTSAWGNWTACTKTCGGGEQTRTRVVEVAAANGGLACPTDLTETRPCNTQLCPVDCVVGNWGAWTPCTTTCGSGVTRRDRPVVTPAANGGIACPELTQQTTCNTQPCPVDCVVSAWTDWEPCSQPCGTGQTKRTRSILQRPANGGAVCPSLVEVQTCNTQPCPIDCVLSAWADWGACSATCGTGSQTRKRTVTTQPMYGGKVCPALEESRDCNPDPCPINCVVSAWSDWGICSVHCGTGEQSRTRTITTPPQYGGTACPTLTDTQVCAMPACAVDCEVTAWSAWSPCTARCGGGTHFHTRNITVNPSGKGAKDCPDLSETQTCNAQACPVDCVVSAWSDWTPCSLPCGSGSQTRHRTITTQPVDGFLDGVATAALPCPTELSQTQTCNTQPCPINCVVSTWSNWGACDKTCGGGVQTRTRTITTPAQYGGTPCPTNLIDSQSCSPTPCPVDCVLSSWSAWTPCTVPCGGGERQQTRTIVVAAANGGKACDALTNFENCNTQPCPINCEMSSWSAWSACSVTCGGGTQSQTRTVVTAAQYGGTPCPTDLTQTQACNTQPCPINCVVSAWSDWGICSVNCGGGKQSRTRTITTPTQYGGTACPELSEDQACNTNPCPVDCVLSSWSDWSTCTRTCGGGTWTRTRTIVTAPANGGATCPALTEQQACSTNPCPVDCVVSEWTAWSTCDKTCGGGLQSRTRTVTTQPAFGGRACPTDLRQEQPCSTNPCPIDCKLSEWGAWGDCSRACGGGTQIRTRSVLVAPQYGGAVCPAVTETQRCNAQPCPVDCVVSAWSQFAPCTKPCGGGEQKRTRTITTAPLYGGKACPTLEEYQPCNTRPCPINCVVDQWEPWQPCDKVCGGGTRRRTRTVLVAPRFGGTACPSLTESEACNTQPCPIDCAFSAWSAWSTCSVSCGTGETSRTRTITTQPQYGGKACPTLIEIMDCKLKDCPVNCTVTEWSVWTACSVPCGGGVHERTRTIVNASQHGGEICPDLKEVQPCNTNPCPIDCVVGPWGAWDTCSKPCGGGTQSRTRSIITQAAFGGQACPTNLKDTQPCNSQACAVNCEVSAWSDWTVCDRTCGTGSQTRTRTVTTTPANGGTACPELGQSQHCNTNPCPVDCVLSDWSDSGCSKACGGGEITRTRTVVTAASNGGKACDALVQYVPCNTQPCPVDCVMSPWSDWSACSATCGGGQRTRTRTVTTAAANGGVACPTERTQTEACNIEACPVDCAVSGWGNWGPCSVTCGGGEQTRVRTITVQPLHGGAACPPDLTQTQRCNTQLCITPCVVTEWSGWSACSKPCGGGTHSRSRTVIQQLCPAQPPPPVPSQVTGSKCHCDVMLVLDKSSSIVATPPYNQINTPQNWVAVTEFVKTLIYGTNFTDESGMRYGIASFDQGGKMECPLGHNKQELLSCVSTIQHKGLGQTTNTDQGVKLALDEFLAKSKPTKCRVIQILTDGQTTSPGNTLWDLITQVKREGITVMSIGVGQGASPQELDRMASEPLSRNSIMIQQFSGLDYLSHLLINDCPKPDSGSTPGPRAATSCPCDLILVLDKSGSISDADWFLLKDFARTLIYGLNITADGSAMRVGIVSFANSGSLDSPLTADRASLIQTIDNLQKTSGATYTHEGIHLAEQELLANSKRACRTVKIVTDGQSTFPDKTAAEAADTKSKGITIFSIGIGAQASVAELKNISTPPAPGANYTNWIMLDDFRGLDQIAHTMVAGCDAPDSKCIQEPCPALTETQSCNTQPCPIDCVLSDWSAWTSCSKDCGGGEQARHRIVEVQPANGGTACPTTLEEKRSCNDQPCPVDCVVSDWSAWTTCDKTCGGGTQTRTRTVTTQAANGGKLCPALAETLHCAADPCPVDCVVSDWSAWGVCSKDCGSGTQTRTRTITTAAANGGTACPTDLTQSQTCNTEACPVNCEVSDWGNWETCSVTCGGGQQKRSRTIATQPANGGKLCPHLTEDQACNTQACPPTDCVVSQWTDFTVCDKACGGGKKTRTRTVITPASNGGTCPALTETWDCNEQACPVDCSFSWSAWSACSVACGGGVQTQTLVVSVSPQNGGKACPEPSVKSQPCNTQACAVNCEVSDWGNWGACSVTCGGGVQSRTRKIITPATNGGTACPTDLSQTQPCNTKACPVDCVVGAWTAWTTCTKTCGGGEQTRTRTVTTPAANGGAACPSLTDHQACNSSPCPVDCILSAWSAWSTCTRACGGGQRTRTRTVLSPALYGGACDTTRSQSEACNTQACPVDCVTSAWSSWDTCSVTCGGGEQKRTRTVTTPPANGGAPCPALTEHQACNTAKCPDTACETSAWTPWSPCTKACGGGTYTRTRKVITAPTGAEQCPALTETRTCNEQPCAVDCAVSDWSVWSACSLTCGGGTQTRTRTVTTQPANGGLPCPSNLKEAAPCNETPCPVDCIVSDWSNWGDCTKDCGGGTQIRKRTIIVPAANGGKACPKDLDEIRHCNDQACAQDCVVSNWSDWSFCNVECGRGQQTRTRTVVQAPSNGGAACPALKEIQGCDALPCPTDCEVSAWGSWSSCSLPCGGGRQQRTRTVVIQPLNNGYACPELVSYQDCNTQPCPVDCVVSEWGAFGACSVPCGGGTYTRTRTVTKAPADGGLACPVLTDTQACNTAACPLPQECLLSAWSTWTTCDKTCGGGWQSRTRTLLDPKPPATVVCPVLAETRSCNEPPCPVDCVISDWSSWSPCDQPCGNGQQLSTRTIITQAAYGGAACPVDLTKTQACKLMDCPVDCIVSEWGNWGDCSMACGGGTQTRARTVLRQAANGGKACPTAAELTQSTSCNPTPCAQDCVVSDWLAWGECSKTCGQGERHRTRSVLTAAANGGLACPALIEYQQCNDRPCPVDCVVSAWTEYTPCDKICGGGEMFRSRKIVTAPANGGSACPALEQHEPCNLQPCPTNCHVSAWEAWGACSVTCGGGVQSRTRTVLTFPEHGGAPCPALVETQACNNQTCPPVACELSAWSDWTACTKACGAGTYTRTRFVTKPAANGGECAADLSETRACNTLPCPTDCSYGQWSVWSPCNVECGTGSQTRTRIIESQAANGGLACTEPLSESQPCNALPCPVDCVLGPWTAWSDCSAPCGGGIQFRTRVVTQPAVNNGKDCVGALREELHCNTDPCAVACVVSEWSAWTPCSLSCGKGEQQRTRTILVAPTGGNSCPVLEQFAVCNDVPCPVDCVLSPWSDWTLCSQPCGTGSQRRSRSVVTAAANGGKPCGEQEQFVDCNTDPCPTDCVVSAWSDWSLCSVSCGTGSQLRTRTILNGATNGGKPCPALTETQSCNTQPCPATTCTVSQWSAWSDCSKACGGGFQTRSRTVIDNPPTTPPAVCPELDEQQACNVQPCPVNCVLSSWSEWSACTKDCGGGKRSRHVAILVQPANGGTACDSTLLAGQTEDCNTQPCPVDCVVSAWSDWTTCDKTCGGGTQTQTRTIVTPASDGGKLCPAALTQTQHCNIQPCAVDCSLSVWSAWEECNKPCGGGEQKRTRTVLHPPLYGGKPCDALVEWQTCNNQTCPVDCALSEWGPFGECSVACGGGQRNRTRTIVTQASNGGKDCPSQLEFETCNALPCPTDCIVSAWGAWSECTLACGGGTQYHVRTISTPALHGGKPCPSLTESQPCNTQACTTDCVVSEWSAWSDCSALCGGGFKVRTRSVITNATNPAKDPCPALSERATCHEQPCPIDCVVSPWTEWDTCTKTCGSGTQTRTRIVEIAPANGGKDCPLEGLLETHPCNTVDCPVDCKVSDWSAWSDCTKTCGGGEQKRTRIVTQAAVGSGMVCPDLEEIQHCNKFECPIDCTVTEWGPWSTCSKPCGTGETTRTRLAVTAAAYGGKACPALVEYQSCNTEACAHDCVVSEWSDWSACSANCAGGTRKRVRFVVTAATQGGKICPDLEQTEDCNLQPCPVDCLLSDWSAWSSCTLACNGHQVRTKTVLTKPANGGKACDPVQIEVADCNVNAPECAVSPDCTVGPWGAWGACTKLCGGGTHIRSRAVTPLNGTTAACPESEETAPCNTFACRVDCVMSDWSEWDTCSHVCGTGSQKRTRYVITTPEGGGVACPNTTVEQRDCNTFSCGADCVVSAFSEWSVCTKTCNGGTQSRTRTVTTPASNGGKACPALTETQHCNDNPCPVDCVVGPWSDWSVCSRDCGGGERSRKRVILTAQANGGQACPATAEYENCNPQPCQQVCQVSAWSVWSDCDKACGTGSRNRTRTVVTQGSNCPALFESQTCNAQSCPVDCVLSDWSAFSECSVSCGSGEQFRTRTVTTKPAYNGKACGPMIEVVPCNEQACDAACVLGAWSDWSPCSKQCATCDEAGCTSGFQTRTRTVGGTGTSCPSTTEERACALDPCDQTCVLSPWSAFDECTATCGGGFQTRRRWIEKYPTGSVPACGALVDTQPCNTAACGSDCIVGNWTEWTPCSAQCNGGLTTRTRKVITEQSGGGAACPVLYEEQHCNQQACNVDCVVTEWNAWSVCSKDCGGGTRSRSRSVHVPASGTGAACPALTESEACNAQTCGVDCQLSAWGAWSTCTLACGGGQQSRARTVTTPASNGGKPCAALTETQECNAQPCDTDCVLSEWIPWPECDKSCGSGSQTRTRTLVTDSPTGKACPPLTETRICNTQPCPVDCQFSSVVEYSACSKDCGGGTQTKKRFVVSEGGYGGKLCSTFGNLEETVSCNTQPCDQNCVLADNYGDWSPCTATCGGGEQIATRAVLVQPTGNGTKCNESQLSTSRPCGLDPCPCVTGQWSSWSPCSRVCGGGRRTRTLEVIRQGAGCPKLLEEEACNTQACTGAEGNSTGGGSGGSGGGSGGNNGGGSGGNGGGSGSGGYDLCASNPKACNQPQPAGGYSVNGAGCNCTGTKTFDQAYAGCAGVCKTNSDCNGNGNVCNGAGVCECGPAFAGPTCAVCVFGQYKNANNTVVGCMLGACSSSSCVNGKCAQSGKCECNAGFAGDKCDVCVAGRVGPKCDKVCDAGTSCNAHGWCLDDGSCRCHSGWTGKDCKTCSDKSDPDNKSDGKSCGWSVADNNIKGGAADEPECGGHGGAIALAVILSILGTLLLGALAFLAYRMYRNRQVAHGQVFNPANVAKSKGQAWNDFEKDVGSSEYTQMKK